MVDEGDVIDKRYEVISEIGQGGMGVVLRVLDRKTKQTIALKYCSALDTDAIRRFGREVRSMSNIKHKHVMPVLANNLKHDPPYFTMPLADHAIVDEVGISEGESLEAFKQICLGVQAIHNTGGTHRDIKPDNAMRLPDGTVVVSDLGLVKFDPRDTTTLTQTAAFIGTRVYCAPEQLVPGGSREADCRTDVYQLGKTLYQMFTSELPALIDRTKVPAGLAYIIERATQQHPDHRYQSVGELMDAVENYVLAQSPGATPNRAFETALQEARGMAKAGNYRQGNLEALLNVLLQFVGDPDVLIQQFERMSRQLLDVIARIVPNSLLPVMRAYCAAVESEIGRYNFEHAEVVARKMKAVFDAADDSALRALAVKATLIAAVRLNRYAAMDVFDSMLTAVTRPEDAVAIGDALREHLEDYGRVADRVPKTKLHVVLQQVYELATRA